MKKFLMVLAFVVLIVAILWILLFHGANFAWGKAPRSSDPLLIEPEEDIRENLFEQTPIGMSMEDALAMIESHEKWELESVNSENGFTYYSKRRIPGAQTPHGGKYSINVIIGEYEDIIGEKTLFSTLKPIIVYGHWGFDEEYKLVGIFVWKFVNWP